MASQPINSHLYRRLIKEAKENPRLRSHHLHHKSHQEAVQRVTVGLCKETYIPPHHHPNFDQWEMLLVLRGKIDLIFFSENREVIEKCSLNVDGDLQAVDIPPGVIHSIYPVTETAMILEVKEGPFSAEKKPTCFANWAPAEGDNRVSDFLSWMEQALPGDLYSNVR